MAAESGTRNRDIGQSGPHSAVVHGIYLLLEKLLHWCINPRLRARMLRLFGASIGRNVRIYEVQLFNLQRGFKNLQISDDAHIGPGCHLDLAARLTIGARATLSPGVTVLTHADPGSTHGSRLATVYPAHFAPVSIGADCWVGASAVVLAGVTLHDFCVVAAGAVVTCDVSTETVVGGVPARVLKRMPYAAKD